MDQDTYYNAIHYAIYYVQCLVSIEFMPFLNSNLVENQNTSVVPIETCCSLNTFEESIGCSSPQTDYESSVSPVHSPQGVVH